MLSNLFARTLPADAPTWGVSYVRVVRPVEAWALVVDGSPVTYFERPEDAEALLALMEESELCPAS